MGVFLPYASLSVVGQKCVLVLASKRATCCSFSFLILVPRPSTILG